MIDLISPNNFEFFARYFLSGFIVFSVRSRYVLGEKPKAGEIVFEAVVLSLLNQLIFLAILPVLGWITVGLAPDLARAARGRSLFFVEVLIQPALLGVVIGRFLQTGWNSAILRRLAMPVVPPKRRAYDFAFTQNETEGFVIITYGDGTEVFGYYGENSLAASDANRSDIYLERLYDVDENGQWFEQTPSRGALLNLDGMRSIEFLEPERTADE